MNIRGMRLGASTCHSDRYTALSWNKKRHSEASKMVSVSLYVFQGVKQASFYFPQAVIAPFFIFIFFFFRCDSRHTGA